LRQPHHRLVDLDTLHGLAQLGVMQRHHIEPLGGVDVLSSIGQPGQQLDLG
jgi:hypothetical protein